jgi:Clp amino terminal domain, pathogenicity island component
MTPLNVNLQELIDQIDADLPDADPVAKIGEARRRARTLVDLGDQLVDHYVHAARAHGASWSQIGDALGVSKQAAQQRRADSQLERFTGRARHVLVLAQDRARTLKHPEVRPEHILLGMLAEAEGLGAKVVVQLAGSADAVTGPLTAGLTPGDVENPPVHLPFDGRAKTLLKVTMAEVVELGHNYVGTEHVLLGLLKLDGPATDALHGAGVDYARARDLVVGALIGLQHKKR